MNADSECAAVFDWTGSFDRARWLEWSTESFAKANLAPDVVTVGMDATKTKRTTVAELREKLNIDWKVIQLFATRPGYKQLAFGWRMCAAVNMTRGSTAILAYERGAASLEEILPGMAGIFGPSYGIGFRREFSKGPDLYAYGMAAGLGYSGEDRAEMDRIGAWMQERISANRHVSGFLRDIYPFNLLLSSHLERAIQGTSLVTWIQSNSRNGALYQISPQQWLWSVQDRDLVEVRRAAKEAGLLIAP